MRSVWVTWVVVLALAMAGMGALMIPRGSAPLHASANRLTAPRVGHPAPDFTLRSLTGSTVTLRSLRGKVVLLNFWATWCTACRAEMPRLAGWYRSLRRSGLVILGIDDAESTGAARAYVWRLGIPYPIAVDPDGTTSAQYEVTGLPTSLLVDRTGTVRAISPGMLSEQYRRTHLEPMLEQLRG
jgi:peroxiredoxin